MLTLAAAIAFMFTMSMALQRLHRQWQVNANGRLNALFSMGRGVDGSQLGRYTKVKRVYIVQCTRNWLKHKLTIIFGYFILEIMITVVHGEAICERWCPCAVHHVRGFTRWNWVNIVTYILSKWYLLTNVMQIKSMWHFLYKIEWNMHGYWSNLTQSRRYTIVGLSPMQWINPVSPDLNLTPLAAFLRFCRAQRGSLRSAKT